MEYISIWILKICVFVYATELQNVQLLSVPEPCPEYAKSTTIADMCTNDFAIEEQINGGVTIDSVALRVMTQQDGCTCEVGLRNQTKMQTIYMRKYDLLTRAAPLDTACGLSIGISYTIPENFPENKTSIECTKGISTRSVSLLPTGILNLRSRIIGGNFIRGYCIQIYRQHITGENVGIQINCSLSNIQTTQQMTDAASDDKIVSAVEQQTITDPCPRYAPNTSIANMCHSGLWKEDDRMGEHRLDSVAIRITTRQKNCVCQVYLHNQNDTNELIMQKYDGWTMAAPKNSDCGLTINISLSSAAGRTNYLTPVECNKGTSFRPITLNKNEKLNFKSDLNEGNFESGYCLQIVRKNAKKEYDPALHVACSQITANKTSNKQTITEDALSEQYVIIGAFTGAIVFVITLAVVFVLIRIYRKRNNDRVTGSNYKQPTQIKSDNDAGYNDSYGLKHNILYQTSDQCDTADGNYHTVEVGERQEVNNAQNIDGDYISIDENVSSNSKYKSEPGIQPKGKTQITKEVLGYKVEHVTPGTGNNVEYAVVNKRDRLGENTEPATSLNNEYAVVDKSVRLDKNIKHVTPKTEAM